MIRMKGNFLFPSSVLAPETALGSVPTVALSSAQVTVVVGVPLGWTTSGICGRAGQELAVLADRSEAMPWKLGPAIALARAVKNRLCQEIGVR